MKNFTIKDNVIVLYASELRHVVDLYVTPIRSSTLCIYRSNLKELEPTIWNTSEIVCKMFYVACSNVHTFFPLLHTID